MLALVKLFPILELNIENILLFILIIGGINKELFIFGSIIYYREIYSFL